MLKENIVNSKDNLQDIKWERAFILYEFHQHLTRESILEISLLNRLIREKLKYRIFKSIKFHDFHLSQLPEYFARSEFLFMSNPLSKSEIANFKSSEIDPSVIGLIKEVDKFSEYFKSIEFSNLGKASYYIIPFTENYCHLTSLELKDCFTDLKVFIKLMVKLDKLENLYLEDVRLMKSSNEGFLEREIILPATLKEIRISKLYLCTANALSNPYEFLFNFDINIEEEEFCLPVQRLPNIHKLEIYRYFDNQRFISSFLSTNPQLSHLILPINLFTLEIIKLLSENNTLKVLDLYLFLNDVGYSTNSVLPHLNSVNSLSIPFIWEEDYSTAYQIIESFPNLLKLDIEMQFFNVEFIANILKKLKHLKSVGLLIQNFLNDELNFELFSNIEVLKFDNANKCAIKFKFPSPPMKLKSITILSAAKYTENVKFLRESCNEDSYWKFKFKGNAMHCWVVDK